MVSAYFGCNCNFGLDVILVLEFSIDSIILFLLFARFVCDVGICEKKCKAA